MYITYNSDNTIYQYNLSTPWDITTASYSGNSFAQTAGLFKHYIDDSGKNMVFSKVLGGNQTIEFYELTTQYDISSATVIGSFPLGSGSSWPVFGD